MIVWFSAFFFFFTYEVGMAMDCVEINKNQSEDELTMLLNSRVVGQKVTSLEEVFCGDIYLVYFEDSTFAVHISIKETRKLIPMIHRFVFHLRSKENTVTEVIDVTTGLLAP